MIKDNRKLLNVSLNDLNLNDKLYSIQLNSNAENLQAIQITLIIVSPIKSYEESTNDRYKGKIKHNVIYQAHQIKCTNAFQFLRNIYLHIRI